jgi:Calcineurin-like phosphoesterase
MLTRHLFTPFLFIACLAASANAATQKQMHPKGHPRVHYEIRVTPTQAQEGTLKSAWVQVGPGGLLEARAVVDGALCPEISVDGHDWAEAVRATSDTSFETVCAANLPAGAKSASLVFRKTVRIPAPDANQAITDASKGSSILVDPDLDIVPLPLPVSDPERIVVLGDTGCRIKGSELQACSDPEKWPFPKIAAEAARLKPDLVIDVGDYLYRENACPANFAGCQGTPFGDNWPTWDADFFTPAKPLLAAAPWVMVRGNHEDCKRAGMGWLRLLGPAPFDPAAPCVAHLALYSVPMGALNLAVMDDANAPDESAPAELVPIYRSEIASLAGLPEPTWLLMHRPIWAAISGPLGIPIGGNQTLIEAAGTTGIPSPVELMLAGHIHTFEAINYEHDDHVPPQIVAGFGGDNLDQTPPDLRGAVFQGHSGVHVKDGISVGGFGFLVMTRDGDGWSVDVHDVHGRIERQCLFHAGRVDCPGKASP